MYIQKKGFFHGELIMFEGDSKYKMLDDADLVSIIFEKNYSGFLQQNPIL
jgi:hypothetical protein